MKVVKGIFGLIVAIGFVFGFVLTCLIIQGGILFFTGTKYNSVESLIIFILVSNIISNMICNLFSEVLKYFANLTELFGDALRLVVLTFASLIIKAWVMYTIDLQMNHVMVSTLSIWVLAFLRMLFFMAKQTRDKEQLEENK
ncbi:MAG: hypothetical protein ATN36_03540 [Epulopiscium sp. Nele67-Bin005]|nr:MAG: hypothetical protein ATN36_03540 [Epulopiscium sp. Nele67-Bin005]